VVTAADWQTDAQTAGIEPALVEEVALRYRQHAAHARERGGTPLELAQWFRFYALENAASLSADRMIVDGCSVDERSVPPPSPLRVRALYSLLRRCLGEPTDAGSSPRFSA
jgi:hypothetical protein